ncbi:MAG: hypothetical protein Q8L23_10970 [Caulobacter sp.]|nr:hypothetical protein [Caulobacter sp.]
MTAALLMGGFGADNGGAQVQDSEFRPGVGDSRFPAGKGPRICQDQGHFNFHRLDGRFHAFGELLRADGYQLEPLNILFDAGIPQRCDVLVIANAQPSDLPWDDYPRPTPSAFSKAEMAALHDWVAGGGNLLLIADHMPLAGASADLATAFGFHFQDGFAARPTAGQGGAQGFTMPDLFRAEDGTLADGPITDGRYGGGRIAQVATFIGQAFQAEPGAQPLLVLPPGFVVLMPDKPWVFTPQTPRTPAAGWLQGATRDVGLGRVAVFGEAAMFTSQIASNGQSMGLDAPGAEQNRLFVRNVVRWLSERSTTDPEGSSKVVQETGGPGR